MTVETEIRPQRLAREIDPTSIKLKPGQYLITTPENYEEYTVGREKHRSRVSYNGTAYGIRFEDGRAVIDDETVREIRDVMLAELEGDENRLPPWFRDENGSAEDLARKLQSDFGYTVTPKLRPLKKMNRAQIYASGTAKYNESDELTAARSADAGEGQHVPEPGQMGKRQAPSQGRKVLGVDPDAEVKEPEPPAKTGGRKGSK